MAKPLVVVLALLVPVLVSLSVPFVLPKLRVFGVYQRQVVPHNNARCEKIESLRSCEDTWLHEESGLLYAACGNSPEDRQTWFPCNDHWDAHRRTGNDYLAVLDTANQTGSHTSRTKKLKLKGFHGLAGEGSLTVHGMGTWQDPSSDRLRLFVVNHRPPVDAVTGAILLEEAQKGANSTIEIFETRLGSDEATHIRTIAHPLINTPNDVDGAGPDSFYVSNDHHVKRGHAKLLDMFLPLTNVVHCDEHDCKVALKGISFANGISKAGSGTHVDRKTWFLSSTASDKFYVLEAQADHSLVITDTITLPYASDNIYSPSSNPHAAYLAVFPKTLSLVGDHFKNPREKGTPAGIMKISKNTDHDAFFGEKWKVERYYEDGSYDPESPSGITGVAVDEERGKLYLASLYQPYMWMCDVYEQPQRVKF